MATPGGGGLLGQLFGPLYDSMQKKAPAPPVVVAVPPTAPAKPVAAAPAPRPERLPQVVPVPRAQPIMIPQMGGGFEGFKPLTPEELMAAAETLGLNAKSDGAMPSSIDLSDLLPDQGAVERDLSNMPADIRPIANLMDTIYKTNVSGRTPNLPGEYLEQLKAKAGLRDGGQAIKQVMGQARLAEFKAKLDEWSAKQGAQSPLEKAKMYEALSKALKGGGGAEGLQMARMQLGITKDNIEAQLAANKENRAVDKDLRKEQIDITERLEKDPIIMNLKNVQSRGKRLRQALYGGKSGIGDITAVREYLKSLEDSAVMFNEAQSMGEAQGIIERAKNLLPNFIQGGTLGDKAKQEMAKLSSEYEKIAEQDAHATIAGKLQSAADIGVNPAPIQKAIQKRISPAPDYIYFNMGGRKVRVKGVDVEEFKREHAKENPVMVRE